MKLPGPAPIDPLRPYQLQTLADIRAGSLPPDDQDQGSPRRRKRTTDDGTRTEPESATEDTTGYSSSDQYEKTGIRKSFPQGYLQNPNAGYFENPQLPQYNLLLTNPQVMQQGQNYPTVGSFFHASQPYGQTPLQSQPIIRQHHQSATPMPMQMQIPHYPQPQQQREIKEQPREEGNLPLLCTVLISECYRTASQHFTCSPFRLPEDLEKE